MAGKKLSLGAVLDFPAFLLAVFVFYWSLPFSAICHRIQFTKLWGRRNDVLGWSQFLMGFFGVTIYQYGDNTLYKGAHCLYLCNHRSWADFFIDNYVTEGRAAFLSRWMVFCAFPIFCSSVIVLRGIVFFKRTTIKDKEAFNDWLDKKLAASWVPAFLVYPEGHRSLKPRGLPLRRGMLHYAYGRKLPVQIIVTRDKERVMSEKQMSMHFGVKLVTGFSKVIKSSDFATFEDFASEVQQQWDAMWTSVYGADIKGLKPLSMVQPHQYAYPASMKLQQFALVVSTIALLLAVVFGACRLMLALAAGAAAVRQGFLATLVAWLAVSLVRSLRG